MFNHRITSPVNTVTRNNRESILRILNENIFYKWTRRTRITKAKYLPLPRRSSWTHPDWLKFHTVKLIKTAGIFKVRWDIRVSCDVQVLQQGWLIKQKPTMQISWRKKITLANGECSGRRWMPLGFTFDWEKRSRAKLLSSNTSSSRLIHDVC